MRGRSYFVVLVSNVQISGSGQRFSDHVAEGLSDVLSPPSVVAGSARRTALLVRFLRLLRAGVDDSSARFLPSLWRAGESVVCVAFDGIARLGGGISEPTEGIRII